MKMNLKNIFMNKKDKKIFIIFILNLNEILTYILTL